MNQQIAPMITLPDKALQNAFETLESAKISTGYLCYHIHGTSSRKNNMDILYDPHDTFENFRKKVLQGLGLEAANISLSTEPVQLTSHNWENYKRPGLICNFKIHPMGGTPLPPVDPFKSPVDLPMVSNPSELFEQQHGASVIIQPKRHLDQTVIVTCTQASESPLGSLGRIWECLKGVKCEGWFYANGKSVTSGRLRTGRRTIFLDTGHAFRGKPRSQVFEFCLVQESVLDVPDSVPSGLDLPDIVDGTPIYRVRKLANADEAKRYMLADAIDWSIGTIGSYTVVAEGAEVDELCQKQLGERKVWI